MLRFFVLSIIFVFALLVVLWAKLEILFGSTK